MSGDDNGGGPAFPCEGGVDSGLHPWPGMTLRDWFASQALAAMLRSDRWAHGVTEAAHKAYQAADAMLKARGPSARQEAET